MQAGYGIPGEPLEGLLLAGSLMDAAWLLKKIQRKCVDNVDKTLEKIKRGRGKGNSKSNGKGKGSGNGNGNGSGNSSAGRTMVGVSTTEGRVP
ncbi:hypothetical protein M0804_012995 [Polistes exclamans]|nr:hypothetical protein M0804_012995 [Polistes exclamans]